VFSVSTELQSGQETSRHAGRGELSFPNATCDAGSGLTAMQKVDAPPGATSSGNGVRCTQVDASLTQIGVVILSFSTREFGRKGRDFAVAFGQGVALSEDGSSLAKTSRCCRISDQGEQRAAARVRGEKRANQRMATGHLRSATSSAAAVPGVRSVHFGKGGQAQARGKGRPPLSDDVPLGHAMDAMPAAT